MRYFELQLGVSHFLCGVYGLYQTKKIFFLVCHSDQREESEERKCGAYY